MRQALLYYLAQTWNADLHRQTQRDKPARAASQARQFRPSLRTQRHAGSRPLRPPRAHRPRRQPRTGMPPRHTPELAPANPMTASRRTTTTLGAALGTAAATVTTKEAT